MPYGFVVKNINNEIQIDSKFRNYSLDEQGTATITNNNQKTDYYTSIGITSSSLIPLILIQPSTDYYVTLLQYFKDTNGNWNAFSITTEARKSTTVNWISCRVNRTKSNDTYGIRVYDENGNLCFDSGNRYLKILEVHTINLDDPTSSNLEVEITHSNISNPYYIISPINFWIATVGYNPYIGLYQAENFRVGLKKTSSTSVKVGWFPYAKYYAPTVFYGGTNKPIKLLICKI